MRKGDAAQNLKVPVRVTNPKILILEDNQNDADLLLRELKRSGLIFTYEVVQNRAAYEYALQNFNPDLILSDYALPSFDAATALKSNKANVLMYLLLSFQVR
jgi:CheY-like chemotaxis protein